MSKQSNSFQKAIHYIFEQIESSAFWVKESVIIRDFDTGTGREVDILVKSRENESVAIECRDWKHPVDIQWIDQLIGKYGNNSEIKRVVAVSASGFTKAALSKANKRGIATLSPEVLLESERCVLYDRLRLAETKMSTEILRPVEIQFENGVEWNPTPDFMLWDSYNNISVPLNMFFECLTKSKETMIIKLMEEANKMQTAQRSISDFDNKQKAFHFLVDLRESKMSIFCEGNKQLGKMEKIIAKCIFRVSIGKHRSSFDASAISFPNPNKKTVLMRGELETTKNGKLKVEIIHFPDDKKIRGFWETKR